MAWIERLDVVGIEPLQLMLRISQQATYSHLKRLENAGYVERHYDRFGSLVSITREGRRVVGAGGPGARVEQTRGSGSAHLRAVSWMAARLSQQDREWVSDREARNQPDWLIPIIWPGARGTHRPDLGVSIGDQRIAVEVELSPKAPRRLRAILAGYEAAINNGGLSGGVIYISDRPNVLAGVERAARQVGLPEQKLRLRDLADVQADVRAARAPLPQVA